MEDIEYPDVLVFDLDPGERVEWPFVTDTALRLREMLAEEGHRDSWPKLTGGKGVHVVVPIERGMTHNQAHAYCRGVAERLAGTDPQRYMTSAALAKRPGRLFVDYLRNGRGTTAIGTYSLQNGADSMSPNGPMIFDALGHLYGTALRVVFQITP